MKLRNTLFLALTATMLLSACGKEEKSAIASGVVPVVTTCPVGTVQQGTVCVAPNGTVVQPISPVTGAGTGARFYSENWRERNLNVAGAGYANFIRDAMGVCGPWTQQPDCSYWNSGALDIVLLADNTQANQLTAVFRLKPRGAGPMFPPRIVPLNFTLSVTNNNQGFEARTYGDFQSPANRSLIQIQVATGKLQDTFFDYRIAYRGEIIITGRFQKCGTADCGLNKNIGN